MRLYGLMITKGDPGLFADWCADQLRFYDTVVCLDGSESDDVARVARRFSDSLIYLHERDFDIPLKTDHGLRRVVHEEIVRRFGADNWVMCCHADEFCYHDPRKVAALAEREGYGLVSWFSLHFYPHPDDRADWPQLAGRPVPERVRHYHWDYRGTGLPWMEDRLYRNGRRVAWDGETHGQVRPRGVGLAAPFQPILRHFKVHEVDSSAFEVIGSSSYYRGRWSGLEDRTGLAFPVRRAEDLFVASVPGYDRCDRFDGTFPHPWNMGEEFRPDPSPGPGPTSGLRRAEKAIPARPATGKSSIAPIGVGPAIATRPHPLQLRDRTVEVPFTVRGPVDEAILREVWERDVYGMRRLAAAPATVLDIGAHTGAFAILAASAWPSARVVACEADPENATLLRRHVAGLTNVAVVEAAIVGGEAAEVDFRMVVDKATGNSGGGSCVRSDPGSRPVRVPARSIASLWDSLGWERCHLLKLDCEGSELEILKALSVAGLLTRVGRVVGEWHAVEGSDRMQLDLAESLGKTHAVTFTPWRGREGYFVADPAR